MRVSLAFLFVVIIITSGLSQKTQGIVLDSESLKPLGYASVRVPGRDIGLITLFNGEFAIDLADTSTDDVILVSYIGYDSLVVPISSLKTSEKNVLKLRSKSITLLEIEILSIPKVVKLGNSTVGRTHTGWGDMESMRGRSRGLVIDAGESPSKVKSFAFRINHNDWDSVRFRLNFFALKNDSIDRSLLGRNIYITTSSRFRWVSIALDKNEIVLSHKVLLVLEWVDAWGKVGEYSNLLTLSNSKNQGAAFLKEANKQTGIFTKDSNAPAMYIEVYGD